MFRPRPVINALSGVRGVRAPIASSRMMQGGGLAEHLIGRGSRNGARLRQGGALNAAAARKRAIRATNPYLGAGVVRQHGQSYTTNQIRHATRFGR